MPPEYATEVQTVMNALNDMRQQPVKWDCGTTDVGVIISDSLMFQRGQPEGGDPHLSHFYGLALPLLKRGIPVTPVQLENLTLPDYLKDFRVLLLTYHGMKPLSAGVHQALAAWVKRGGVLVVCDNDTDPYKTVREWWNSGGLHYRTPREDLFVQLGWRPEQDGVKDAIPAATNASFQSVGKGGVMWIRENPSSIAKTAEGDGQLATTVKQAAAHAGLKWRETNYLLLRRGPYILAAGLDESVAGEPKRLTGRFVNLFDPELRVQRTVVLVPKARLFLLDLNALGDKQPRVLASACKSLPTRQDAHSLSIAVEGVVNTPAVVFLRTPTAPRSVKLAGQALETFNYGPKDRLLWIRFTNEARPRELEIVF